MGIITTSCWVCGGWITKTFTDSTRDETKWGTCPQCVGKVARTGGESRVLEERVNGMKMVYVCAPFRGDIQGNMEKAKNIAIKLAVEAADKGEDLPFIFVPHLAFQYTVHGEKETYREWALRMCVKMVGVVDELVVCGEEMTEGMRMEIEEANLRGIGVTYRGDLK